ncbi:MAG: tetratricopeptide repeat protein [Verrucomicrobiales bacterium]|nr:tetratricopeptide repeat protein [Verrucomicrobiales bacterium]
MEIPTPGKYFAVFFLLITPVLLPVDSGLAQEEKKSFFRFSSNKKAKKEDKPQLGVASGAVHIPLELRDIAQDGAELISRGKWKEARELYLKMVLQAPGNPLAYANLGVAEYQLKNYTEAERNLKKSLDLNSSIAQNWMTLGLIQFERGELLLAISSLTRAIHEDPKSAQAHLYLAAVAYDYGWTNAAIKELNQVVDLDAKNSEAHFNLAMTYLGLRPPRLELARRHYETAKDLGAPPHPGIEEIMKKSSE